MLQISQLTCRILMPIGTKFFQTIPQNINIAGQFYLDWEEFYNTLLIEDHKDWGQ